MKHWALVLATGVNVYLLGVMVMFAAVVYPSFGAVERASFAPLYQSFNGRIGVSVVLWEFVALFATLALYAWRPASVSIVSVHALTALGVAYFAITFGWHLPAHRPLAAGDNAATALAPLASSQWARTAVQFARAATLLWLSSLRAAT
jgi:hypothetical protein